MPFLAAINAGFVTSRVVLPGTGASGDAGGGSSIAWGGDRGLFGGGQDFTGGTLGLNLNTIDYVDITTPGNATDFGDLTVERQIPAACSSSTRGVWGGGELNGFGATNTLDYITIATTGNAIDFGDLTVSEKDHPVASSNGTIGLFGAGNYVNNRIDSITIATTGNATDFGDLSVARDETNGAAGDATRCLWFGGYNGSNVEINTIDYNTYASAGNAIDFGDLTVAGRRGGAASDETRAVVLGGTSRDTTIDYVTIQTTGNATDFGDCSSVGANNGATSGTYGIFSGNLDIQRLTIQTLGNATDFGDLSVNRILSAACAGSPSGSSGGGGGNAAANGFIVRNNFTGMSNERFYGIGTDSSNNFYATGYDAVDDNILIAKYNSSGTFQWASKAANAGNGPDRIFGSQVDSSGNVITGGYSYSHSGGSPYPALITKYQPDGTEVYTKVFTDSGSASWIGQATAIDSNDNFYITGRGRNQSSNNNDYTFVAKLNSAGAMVWIQKLDHGGQQSNGRALAIDSNDNVIVAGAIHEEITGSGYSSGFVAKLSGTDGSITWQRILNDTVQANGYHNDSFYSVTVDSNDDVYTTGWNNFEYLGTYYTPIVKLSGTDGSVTWQRRHLTTNGSTGISAIGTSVYVVTDNNSVLIYNTSGTLTGEWEVTATSGSYYVEDVKPDQNGNAVIVGFYYSTSSQAEPFFAVLPATIIAGTSDNFVLTAGTLGDVAGTLATNAFTTISSNAVNSITVSNASNMASSTQASDGNVITAITGGSSGGGGSSIAWGGDRAIIWGSNSGNNDGIAIDYFDITTPGNASDFGDVHRQVDGFGPGKYEGSCVSDTTYGVYAGGKSSYNLNSTNQIDYITISTLGNSATFGNLTTKTHKRPASASDGTTGYFSGGQDDYNVTYYTGTDTITIATQGNATLSSFVLATGIQYTTGTQDTTRMLISGGYTNNNTNNDLIQYLTFASAGTAQTFGNLTVNRAQAAAISDNTYALIGGGYDGANLLQSTDVVTIQTTGNATNFGNLVSARRNISAVSNGTYGCFCAGHQNVVDIDLFTIATSGNATDFGDLIGGGEAPGACSGSAS